MGRLTALAAVVALALPAGAAAAGKIRLQGDVVGVPSSNVQLTVTKEEGRIGEITKLKFQRVPLTCEDGTSGAISGTTVRPFPVRGKDFTRRSRIEGFGIEKGYFRVSGKFRRGGRVAKGFVRFAITATTGSGCGTGNVRWKATK